MLIRLKNKQSRLVSMVLSIFIGNWLLLFCQSCVAATVISDFDNHYNSSKADEHCHVPSNENSMEVKKHSKKAHCLGLCDCDVMTIAISSDKNDELKEKIKFSADVYAFITPELTLSDRAPPEFQIFIPPERASLLPFHTYNVLLI